MKKLLAILAVIGLTATEASSVVACNKEDKKEDIKNLSSYSDGHKKIALAVSNAIAKTANKAIGENTFSYKAINGAVIDTLKSISKIIILIGSKLQVNVLDEKNSEFTSHHSEFKNGDKIIIAVKALSGLELKGNLKVNLTVTDQVVVNLTKVTITVPDQTIPGDTSVDGKTPTELSAFKFFVKAKSTKATGKTPKFSVKFTKA